MSIKRKVTPLAVAAIVGGMGLVAGAGPANAINRFTCNSNEYLKIFSNSSTCWGNAGVTGVALYNTTQLRSGNNAGRVDGPGFYRHFAKYATSAPWHSTTITKITIN